MRRPFRFAVQGGPFADAGALADHARRVEALGYDELFTADHIGAVDPFAPLLVAASATERLRVGPLVLDNELHHPVLLARTAATVDRLTGGRLVIGLGTGYDEAEHVAIGAPIRPPGPRVTRLAESLTVLRSLLDEGSAHLDGDHIEAHVDDLGVRPVQARVPILVGGHGRRVLTLAARHADIVQFTGLVHGEGGRPSGAGFAVEHVAERARWLDTAGDDPGPERSALVQFVAIGDDAPTVAELAERFDRDAATLAATPFVLTGSVSDVVDRLHGFRDRFGISHWVVRDAEGFAPVVAALTG